MSGIYIYKSKLGILDRILMEYEIIRQYVESGIPLQLPVIDNISVQIRSSIEGIKLRMEHRESGKVTTATASIDGIKESLRVLMKTLQ